MAVPSALVLKCASCGEEGPHRVLQGRVGGRRGRTFHGTVKCTHCGTVSSATYREPRTVSVDLLVSWMDKTEHHTLDLDETRAVAVGEQFPAEGGTVEVTSLEVGGRRRGRGLAGEITTIWAKRADTSSWLYPLARTTRTSGFNRRSSPNAFAPSMCGIVRSISTRSISSPRSR